MTNQSTVTPRSASRSQGAFDTVGDVGPTNIRGSTVYDPEAQTYTVTGSGRNIWFKHDEFQFAALKIGGDFILTAEAHFLGEGVNPHRKWGVMFRRNLDADSVHAEAAVHGDGLTSLQYRPAVGVDMLEVTAPLSMPQTVQLERAGQDLIMRAAKVGEALTETGRVQIGLDGEVYAGLFVCSHETDVAETAVFRNVRLDVPAAAGVDGYRQPSASRLELLDVDTGHRRVIYTSTEHFEAPNWSRDGDSLLFNQDGLIYRLALRGGAPEKLDTGGVRANNNDHGLSFDGMKLALSSHTESPGNKAGSQIFVVDAGGGEPLQVTDEAPSYWHGWSPDGRTLVYCAERHGSYDIYSVPSTGGPETRLTDTPGLDDGPEYSPDGRYVYFNSTRTGQMQIWRMRPDGSGQEQVSSGGYNDWFAHPSPDGARLLYVSYPLNVPAESHPHNQWVMIREQRSESGEVRVLAHLYGGQGTLNVPSWSPDGRQVAFVSYTYGDPSV